MYWTVNEMENRDIKYTAKAGIAKHQPCFGKRPCGTNTRQGLHKTKTLATETGKDAVSQREIILHFRC